MLLLLSLFAACCCLEIYHMKSAKNAKGCRDDIFQKVYKQDSGTVINSVQSRDGMNKHYHATPIPT